MQAGRRWPVLILAGISLLPAGCARRGLVVEMSGNVMYDKPKIGSVSHILTDDRADGGPVAVRIALLGDPGLQATFDISPGVADHAPLQETSAGRYEGSFSFPTGAVGGPFTLYGRLWHERAGEMVARDPESITIRLFERGF